MSVQYAKTAAGERLTYRPDNLHEYAGEQFCLRITPGNIDLDRCFFVYLDERFEEYSLRRLVQTYFMNPGTQQSAEMAISMKPWLHMDPMLPKKLMLLRQMFGKVREHSGKVLFYINHAPGPVNPEDTVRSHLGTSVFADGSFNDKILDLVLEFHADDEPLPEMDQWARFDRIDTLTAGMGTKGPTRPLTNRRNVLSGLITLLIAILGLPCLIFSCQNNQNQNGGGFGGGML